MGWWRTRRRRQTPAEGTHKEPVWRDRANFIIRARIEDVDERGGDTHEQLWARQLEEFRFELCCIPYFLYDMALGDVVETDADYNVIRVVQRGGRWVFRLFFEAHDVSAHSRVHGELLTLGALMEWRSLHFAAIDCPNAELAQTVADYLAAQEADGVLVYETGKQQTDY